MIEEMLAIESNATERHDMQSNPRKNNVKWIIAVFLVCYVQLLLHCQSLCYVCPAVTVRSVSVMFFFAVHRQALAISMLKDGMKIEIKHVKRFVSMSCEHLP